MKVYVFYYSDGDGYSSPSYIFKTREAAEEYRRLHPEGAWGKTWYDELELSLDNDLMIDLKAGE